MTRHARRRLFLTTALAGTLLHGAARAADLPVPTNAMEPGLTYNGANTRLDVDLANTSRILNWTSFDVAANKIVNFTTADTAGRYSVLNRVAAGDASDIFGAITSTGNIAVWLANPSGITFGATGSFSGGSLVLTTAAVSDADWGAAIASADPAGYLVPLTGAPVPVAGAGAITLASGSVITASGGVAAAAQSVTAGGKIAAAGEVALVAATDLALPFGVGSPLGVRIDKGTKVGRLTVAGTAQIDAAVVRLAGASTEGQAAYLLQVDDGAALTATAVGGKVILAAGVAGDGVTLGATPANVAGAASIQYDGKAAATQAGGTATLAASGDIATTTANGTIGAAGAIGIAAGGNATIGAALTSTGGNVTVGSSGATLVRSAVGAGGAYQASGASVTLGTAGTAITQQAAGAVTITATGGLLAGLDGLTLQSGSAGADAALTLSQAGTGGIAFAAGSELIGGTFAAGPPPVYGFGADVVVSAIGAAQPLTLGNVHARALTLPGGLTGTITAGDIVVADTLTLNTGGAIRLRSGTSRTGDVALTATGDVTGLARSAAATDGRLVAGYDRADLAALAVGRKATVGASKAQLGTVTAGTGTTIAAGEQVAVDATAIDVASATAANGTLRLTATLGEARLGSGSAGIDGTVAAATSVRLGSLAARTGNAAATATGGDVTGLALAAAATDGRLVAGYGRAALAAQAAAKTVAVNAAAGNAQLGTIGAGAGTTSAAGAQATVDARAIDVATATSFNGALRLTATAGEVRLGTGTGGSNATVGAATNARIGSLTATIGNVSATATAGDVTGLALSTAATDGRLVAGYGRAAFTALAANGAITVAAAAGTAQLGTATAGTGTTTVSGEEIAVDAQAIDATGASAANGALRLTASAGEVRLGTGTGGTDATIGAATGARIGSLAARTGNLAVTAAAGDVTGLARAVAAADGRLVAGYERADLAAQAAAKTVTVTAAAGYAQLGTVTAGSGTTAAAGDQIAADARAIDVTAATAQNGALRLTSTVGEVRIGSGTGGTDATVTAATGARIGSLTAGTGAASATATAGDVTGLALATPATDGRLVADYGRADLAAQAAAGIVTVKAAAGNAQLGTVTAGSGASTATGDQLAVDAQAIDVTAATTQNGALRLTSTVGEVRLGSGTGGSNATVSAATNARIGSLTAGTGAASASATAGDVTGLALATPATDGRLVADYGRADLAAQAAAGIVTVKAAAGSAQLDTVTAGSGASTATGDQLAVDAQAIDVTAATAQNGALRLTSTVGEVRLGTGTGGTDATVSAATNARIGSLTARAGGVTVTAQAGDATGLALAAPATDGRPVAGYDRADLTAQAAGGAVAVKAAAGAAQLGTATAGTGTTTATGDQLAVDAQAIDVTAATTQNGALRLTSTVGEVRLATGTGGTDATIRAAGAARIGTLATRTGDVSVTATAGDVTGLALAAPAGDGRLVAAYGRADLAAQAAERTVAVAAAAGYAQLGTVTAGTGATTPAGDQIAVDARAIDALTADARDGALRLTSTISEVRVASGHGGTGGTILAATSARVGDLTTRTGAIAITAAAGDATGLATAATDSRPETGYGLTTLDAGTGITVAASDDVQLGTIHAAADIAVDAHPADPATASANEIAWLGGPVTAAGHYRVTGGSVVLGAPGGIAQSAGADLIVRSLAGGIEGGAGLALASGAGSTSAANPLILYSAANIALPGDSTLTAGEARSADIGLAAPAGLAIALGSASARRIGTAVIDASQPTGYRIDARLALPNPITARKLVTTADLVIDTTAGGTPADITLDEAESTAGGISLATTGDLKGGLLSGPPALYQRTRLTAFDGIVVHSGLALLDIVTAGTGAGISAVGLDALGITANAGDVALRTSGDMRIGSVIAHGNGGDGAATLLADPTIPLSSFATPGTIRTAGDIAATASGDITGTAGGAPGAFGLATFAASDGAVTLASDATGTDKGLLALDTVTAGGTTAGHSDARLAGRQISVATGVDSTAGSTFVTARQLGSQSQVGAAIARATAAGNVAIDIGYGTAPSATADNGSLRIGTVRATAGNAVLTAHDGSVTGLTGAADGLDPAHARAAVSAGGTVTVVAGKLVQLGELAGQDVGIAAGDDVLADIAQQGAVTHQDGAIDIAHLVARGGLTLTAAHGAAADGVSGIRLGARASGLADGGPASQAGATATLRTLGTLGDVVIADGLTAQADLTVAGIAGIRASALTSATGGLSLATTGGDVTGLVLPVATTDGRLAAGYDRTDLAALAAGRPIAVNASGTVQLGTATAGTGAAITPGVQLAVDARAIDIVAASARNGALRLTSTAGEIRLAAGDAGTAATIGAATDARIATLTARTGSIGVTAAAGDVTGLSLPAAAGDGRPAPAYARADLAAQAAATDVAVAAAGIAQLGTVTAGTGDTTAATGGIAVDARAIDVTTAAAQNAALRLTATVGEVRLASGTAGTVATIGAAGSVRIGTLTTRTGSIAVAAAGGDVTGLALAAPVDDGRPAPTYARADLTAQAAATDVAVTAAGIAQLGTVTAGTGDTTAVTGGIAVDAALIEVTEATARNAAVRLAASVGEARIMTGTAGTDATIAAATSARIGVLTTRTGSILATAAAGDVTGLGVTPAAGDGRMVADYDRAVLTAQAAATNVTVDAAGTAQLGTVTAGTGGATVTSGGIAVTAGAIDLIAADARNAALRLTSTVGETRLATGTAGTDAAILAANNSRIGTLTTRTGSIGVTATAGDATGLVRPAPAGDGRLVAAYDRADLTALADGQPIVVKAAAGGAQLGTVLAGTGQGTSAGEQIAVDARAIDIVEAAAQNGALRLAATVGEVRLATGVAGTDATILAANSARIGTLAARTGSIAVTATAGDVTGLVLAPAADDGRLVAGYARADLAAQAIAANVTVTALAGTAQLGTVTAGSGDTTAPAGGIAVAARAIDVAAAAARNAALRLAATAGDVRLATGAAGTDATIAAAANARIGTLAARTGSIAATAVAGDVTGLALAGAAADGRLVAGYGRADLAAAAAARTIAVTAAAGSAQLGAVTAGTGAGGAGEQVAVDARAIDVATAAAGDGALRLASTAGETRLRAGTAATGATIRAAMSARIGDLTARTGAVAVTATAGDVTGLAATVPAADTRPFPTFGRANLTASSATGGVTVAAAAGTAQLGTATAGADALSTGGGGITVTARAVDASAANARTGGLALTATADRLYLGQGIAATAATLDKQGAADKLRITGALAATGNATLASTTDIDLPVTPAAISAGDTLAVRNGGANATALGTGATGTGFTLTEAEVNSLKAPKLTIDSRANGLTVTNLAVAAAAGSTEIDLLGTGGVTLAGTIANSGGGARTIQIGGAVAGGAPLGEAAIEAKTALARQIVADTGKGAAIVWTNGTVDLRAQQIVFGDAALQAAVSGRTPEAIAVTLVAVPSSPLYTGQQSSPSQSGRAFLTAGTLKVSYSDYALFQNSGPITNPTGVKLGDDLRSVAGPVRLQLFSTGDAPANSFALFGTINGFEGRTAGLLPAGVIEFADLSPRIVRITQANSRVNGCVVGSQEGCLVTNAPPTSFQLFDERQILLFGTADDAGLTFDPLIGTNNESLIGDIDPGTLGINSIDCSAPGTRDCPAAGEKP